MYRNKNKGFTFIELILYMAILGIFMVAVTSLVGSTVASHRKLKSRQKLETQASEVYDTISDMLMGASNVRINGDGYVGSGTSYSKVTASFIVPNDTMEKAAAGSKLTYKKSPAGDVTQDIAVKSGAGVSVTGNTICYDIADVKPFADEGSSKDPETFIDAKYLWVQYSASLNETAYCTIGYDETNKKLYIYRTQLADTVREQAETDLKSGDNAKVNAAKAVLDPCTKFVDAKTEKGTVLANNVESFRLQVNPDDGSVAVTIGLKDSRTNEKYEVTSVVGLRNSFVLKKHEWN